jgi:hypothetical protein
MTKALVTFATGNHTALLDIARPGFMDYAGRHDYDYLERSYATVGERPVSWSKVPVLLDLLSSYDTVLWLDADVIIADGTDDIAAHVPADAWQALVKHHTTAGEVPNCGIWLLRKPMIPILEQIWEMRQYIDHPWWEQAAMLKLLGYEPDARPVGLHGITELYAHTHFLPLEWNSDEFHDKAEHPKFCHYPGLWLWDRLAAMQDRIGAASDRGPFALRQVTESGDVERVKTEIVRRYGFTVTDAYATDLIAFVEEMSCAPGNPKSRDMVNVARA